MKFIGKPHMGVYERNRNPKQRHNIYRRRIPLCRFDENGEFETDDPALILKLERKFKSESAPVEHPAPPADKPKSYSCKKCDFSTENKGDLLAHYRKQHPRSD